MLGAFIRPPIPRRLSLQGPLSRFFSEDHRRLDELLERATRTPDRIAAEPFALFRSGLLRHIAMEEKVLIPAAREARRGEPLPAAAKLRIDHGAFTALLVPTPTAALVVERRALLDPHNRREEAQGGLYETCDDALGEAEAARLVARLREFPAPPLNPHNDGPLVRRHVRETVERARRQWEP